MDDSANECLLSIPHASISDDPEGKEHPADIERIGKLCVIVIDGEVLPILNAVVDLTKDQLVE